MEVTKYGGGVRHVKFLLHLSSNFKIPAFAEAASRRQANVKGMSKFKIKNFII